MVGMRYVIAGSSGFLGTALREALAREGHQVVRLMRGGSPSAYESQWDPYAGEVDLDVIGSADVVVNLAGVNVARPWTSKNRTAIRDSRIATTMTLAKAIAAVDTRPAFLAQSAIAAYGSDRGDTALTEATAAEGGGFLHGVVREWEAATEAAERAGARVCHLRTGVVIDRRGGALQAMLPIFRLGLGGRLGSGRQYFSVISLADWVGAVLFLGSAPQTSGAFNLTAPVPPTNAEYTAALGRRLHRPTRATVPAVVLRKTLGELSGELLGSLRVLPAGLEAAGYTFAHRTVDEVLSAGLH
jgi:uncharacterized protein